MLGVCYFIKSTLYAYSLTHEQTFSLKYNDVRVLVNLSVGKKSGSCFFSRAMYLSSSARTIEHTTNNACGFTQSDVNMRHRINQKYHIAFMHTCVSVVGAQLLGI